MFKYYLQLLSVLTTFFGAIVCLGWIILTLMYYGHIVDGEKEVSLNTLKLSLASLAVIVNAVGFYYSVKWVKKTRETRDAKMKKYRELSRL